jgi:hypothetical protein
MVRRKRQRSSARGSTISVNRYVRSLPAGYRASPVPPSLRAMTLKPSCLISCSHSAPEGDSALSLVGRAERTRLAGYADVATSGLNRQEGPGDGRPM